MLPKNTFRDRRLDRLKIFPGEAPEVYRSNTLRTWRDGATGLGVGHLGEGVGGEVGERIGEARE
jgi:large subunit ribosomal protein L13